MGSTVKQRRGHFYPSIQLDERHDIIAPYGGHVVGMAVPQVVLSGYALFHLGLHDVPEAIAWLATSVSASSSEARGLRRAFAGKR